MRNRVSKMRYCASAYTLSHIPALPHAGDGIAFSVSCNIEQRTGNCTVALSCLEILGQVTAKHGDRLLHAHAEHRHDRAGHADIRDIAGALGIDALIRGLHMRVRAPDSRRAAVFMYRI